MSAIDSLKYGWQLGRFAPERVSLRAKVPGLWRVLLQLVVAGQLFAHGWVLFWFGSPLEGLGGHGAGFGGFLEEYTPLHWQQIFDGELGRMMVEWFAVAMMVEWFAVAMMAGGVLCLLMRVRFFAMLRWLLPVLWLGLVWEFSVKHGDHGREWARAMLLLVQPLLLFWVLSSERQLRWWAQVAVLCLAGSLLGDSAVALDEWTRGGMPPGGAQEWVAVLLCCVAVSVCVPFLRKWGLAAACVWGAGLSVVHLLSGEVIAGRAVAEFFERLGVWMLPMLLLMLLPMRKQDGKLTLSLLEISSQTKRVLAKASILYKK